MHTTTPLFRLACSVILILASLSLNGQFDPINPDKATVYIFRPQVKAMADKHACFVDQTFVGRLPQFKYIKLELDPGVHMLWAKGSEFGGLQAKFDAGHVYVINAVHYVPGPLKNGTIAFVPIDRNDKKKLKKLYKRIAKRKEHIPSKEELDKGYKKYADDIAHAESKFLELEQAGDIEHSMIFPVNDLIRSINLND